MAIRTQLSLLTAGLVVAVAACSSSTNGAAPIEARGEGSPSEGADAGVDAAESADASSAPPPRACPTAKYKTLVVVGDSISDIGGGGAPDELPFYRTLLVKNDDAKYPDWKGFDLATCWGLDPVANVVKVSKGGAVATVPSPNNGSDHILLNQVKSLPATLDGPVLVVGTIGGNDVRAGLVAEVTGTAEQQKAKVDAFVAGLDAALTELATPDRFGMGVKADVLITNIYDPSGGTGHFYYAPNSATCPGAFGLWPDSRQTKPALVKWNDAMAAEVAKYANVKLLEMREPFEPHAVSTPPGTNWFYEDCIHPNSAGHDAIRGIFWTAMTALH